MIQLRRTYPDVPTKVVFELWGFTMEVGIGAGDVGALMDAREHLRCALAEVEDELVRSIIDERLK